MQYAEGADGEQIGETESAIGFTPVQAEFKGLTADQLHFTLGNKQGRLLYVGIAYYGSEVTE